MSVIVQKKMLHHITFQCKTRFFFSFPAETEVFPLYLVAKSQWTCTLAIKLDLPVVGEKAKHNEKRMKNTNPFTI